MSAAAWRLAGVAICRGWSWWSALHAAKVDPALKLHSGRSVRVAMVAEEAQAIDPIFVDCAWRSGGGMRGLLKYWSRRIQPFPWAIRTRGNEPAAP